MTSIVELGALEGDVAKPVFRASAGGIDFYVELDSSALLKLAGGHRVDDWKGAVEGERGRIRSAAQMLYDSGFVSGDMSRLFVTAIDIV